MSPAAIDNAPSGHSVPMGFPSRDRLVSHVYAPAIAAAESASRGRGRGHLVLREHFRDLHTKAAFRRRRRWRRRRPPDTPHDGVAREREIDKRRLQLLYGGLAWVDGLRVAPAFNRRDGELSHQRSCEHVDHAEVISRNNPARLNLTAERVRIAATRETQAEG